MKDISKETQRHKRDDTEDLTQLMCTDSCKSYQDMSLMMLLNQCLSWLSSGHLLWTTCEPHVSEWYSEISLLPVGIPSSP